MTRLARGGGVRRTRPRKRGMACGPRRDLDLTGLGPWTELCGAGVALSDPDRELKR